MRPEQILQFWFDEAGPDRWFSVDPQFDNQLTERFTAVYLAATRCELADWRESPQGRLAEVIVLDQFSRNMFRGSPLAYAHDSLALALAQEAVRVQADLQLAVSDRAFLYMPYMHSESPLIHQEAVRLFDQPGLEYSYGYELRHKLIIDRFGRYPHRNAVLERTSTPEELEFLANNPVPF